MRLPTEKERGLAALDTISLYRAPEKQMIPRGQQTKMLYAAEENRSEAIRRCAKEWAKLCDEQASGGPAYWHRAIPQALFDTLLNYDTAGAIVAAEAFLKEHGWTVERPKPPEESVDTSDIPEAGEEFFRNATLQLPIKD